MARCHARPRRRATSCCGSRRSGGRELRRGRFRSSCEPPPRPGRAPAAAAGGGAKRSHEARRMRLVTEAADRHCCGWRRHFAVAPAASARMRSTAFGVWWSRHEARANCADSCRRAPRGLHSRRPFGCVRTCSSSPAKRPRRPSPTAPRTATVPGAAHRPPAAAPCVARPPRRGPADQRQRQVDPGADAGGGPPCPPARCGQVQLQVRRRGKPLREAPVISRQPSRSFGRRRAEGLEHTLATRASAPRRRAGPARGAGTRRGVRARRRRQHGVERSGCGNGCASSVAPEGYDAPARAARI
jgi:hypothetical protein